MAALICFAVWGRISGLSALVGGGISVLASAAMVLIGFASPAGSDPERVARAFYVGEGVKLALTVVLFVVVFTTMKVSFVALFGSLHRHIVRLLDRARERAAAAGRNRERRQALGIE